MHRDDPARTFRRKTAAEGDTRTHTYIEAFVHIQVEPVAEGSGQRRSRDLRRAVRAEVARARRHRRRPLQGVQSTLYDGFGRGDLFGGERLRRTAEDAVAASPGVVGC